MIPVPNKTLSKIKKDKVRVVFRRFDAETFSIISEIHYRCHYADECEVTSYLR